MRTFTMPSEAMSHTEFDMEGIPKHKVESFLTQAMAQNLQIQRQLMEQNEALQKLLNEQSQSLPTSVNRKQSSESSNSSSVSSGGGPRSAPAPPPPPPPLPSDPIEGHRPFVDPYGRAKTVRIGKWRWPPRDSDVFVINNGNKDTQEDEPPPSIVPSQIKANHNFPEHMVVGKLRISNEMRAKLENVTGGPKTGSKKDNVRKIEDDRKAMLMEKLGGRALMVGQTETFSFVPPPPPPPVHDQSMSNDKVKDMDKREHRLSNSNQTVMMNAQNGMSNKIQSQRLSQSSITHQRNEVIMTSMTQEISATNSSNYCLTYGRVNWTLRLRKELLLPWENVEQDKKLLNHLYIQILNDMNSNTLRLTNVERAKLRQLTSTTNSKLSVVQYTIKNTEFYFVCFFPVVLLPDGGEYYGRYDGVTHVGVDLKALKFIKKGEEGLICVEARSLTSVKIRDATICESNVAIQEPYLSYLLNLTSVLNQSVVSPPPPPQQQLPVASPKSWFRQVTQENFNFVDKYQEKINEIKAITMPMPVEEPEDSPEEEQRPMQDDGKHSLLQFAMAHFRHMDRLPKDSNDWTWKSIVSNVKYSPKMIQESLLPLDEVNNQLAVECYHAILCYMGDLKTEVTQVECVYTVLRNCHKSAKIKDEVYCQLMKQTTNNTMTGLAGWRLFTIMTAYFSCSELLKPYLFKYLEVTAYDKRRNFHGTALVALQNLRKTFKYGGRRNVPSVEEITALTAGRNAKRQIFRLPGGNDRVVNVRAATIVEDVLNELCSTLNIRTPHERQEFSIYCIVEGDTFTMPLQLEEYILDVTTELTKNNQVYYLIFCRSVWFYELKLDNPLYVEVIFNQVAPDYLEGLLVVMQDDRLSQSIVHDITRVAALLHRAADLTQPPTLKETKYLLPKPALAARDLKPNQWVQMVNSHWADERVAEMSPQDAKCGVLEILQNWPLFGSSFFTVRRINEPQPAIDYILALNKTGVHFLDMITHETVTMWTYNQVISTRKVKNEDGVLFLDLKVGNLMQQRILRLETEHAHEISRLIRQYIHIQRLRNEAAGIPTS